MSKYIIEIAEEYEEYFKGVLICGIVDGKFAVDVIAREDLEELNSDYINEHYGELQDEAYQRGLDDAWETAKKLSWTEKHGGYGECLDKVFDRTDTFDFLDYSPNAAIEKLKAYEDKHSDRIEVGDEVIAPCGKAIVTTFKNDLVFYLYSVGDYGCTEPENLTKTGRHFDIASILEAMRT